MGLASSPWDMGERISWERAISRQIFSPHHVRLVDRDLGFFLVDRSDDSAVGHPCYVMNVDPSQEDINPRTVSQPKSKA